MRLLLVGPWRTTAMRRHIDWAVESGTEVCVFDHRSSDHVIVPSSFCFVSLLPRRAKAIHQPAIYNKSARAIRIAALRLKQVADSFQPHLIHSYMLDTHTEMCLQAGLRPLVVSVWGSLNGLMMTGATAKDRRWICKLAHRADVLLVENPNLLGTLARLSGPSLRVECFPIGVDGSLFHPGYEEKTAAWRFVLDIPTNAIVLLSPRGWSEVYGQHHIMKAFALGYHRLNVPLVLVLMGMGRRRHPERYAQEVLDLGASLGVAHAIRWIPQVPYQDMPGLYALADIVINYPSSDAFLSTLLEAAACARPVITSHLPAYRNTFVEECFKLVEPENPEALAAAIVDVVGSASTVWPARTQRTRDVVLGECDETVQKQRLMALYREIARAECGHVGIRKKDLTNSLIRATILHVRLLFMLNSTSHRPIHAADAASRVYGTDAVVISPEEGMVRLLNLTATRIWQLADGSRSVDEIATMLTEEYEVDFQQAHQSVTRLLVELSEKKLIAWVVA